MPKIIHIISTIKTKEINFNNYRIKFIKLDEFFGYKKINTNEGELFIAENEKLLIDAFLKYKEMGNFDEINKIIENAEISKDKIIEYLKRIDNQAIIKRIGYLLEKEKGIDISKSFKLNNNYVILNPFAEKWINTNTKWRVKI
jgi:predicted transcriptional regulator of viral defense system